MEPKICKIHEIHAIGVKSMDLVVTGQINSCLENFVGKWSKLVRSADHAAIGMNEISSGEFRVFHRKMVICVFGCHHGSLLVMKNVVG